MISDDDLFTVVLLDSIYHNCMSVCVSNGDIPAHQDIVAKGYLPITKQAKVLVCPKITAESDLPFLFYTNPPPPSL